MSIKKNKLKTKIKKLEIDAAVDLKTQFKTQNIKLDR
jgi:hypothetical protein